MCLRLSVFTQLFFERRTVWLSEPAKLARKQNLTRNSHSRSINAKNRTVVLTHPPAIVQRTGVNKSVAFARGQHAYGRPLRWALPRFLVLHVTTCKTFFANFRFVLFGPGRRVPKSHSSCSSSCCCRYTFSKNPQGFVSTQCSATKLCVHIRAHTHYRSTVSWVNSKVRFMLSI